VHGRRRSPGPVARRGARAASAAAWPRAPDRRGRGSAHRVFPSGRQRPVRAHGAAVAAGRGAGLKTDRRLVTAERDYGPTDGWWPRSGTTDRPTAGGRAAGLEPVVLWR